MSSSFPDSSAFAPAYKEAATPEPQPFVSVIIPHYNDLTNLKKCLAHLERQSWPKERLEIIVADNNSACGVEAVQAAAPGATVVPAPIQGAGPARNAGVAAAKGDVLAFIDSDCFAGPDWIREGVAALARADYIGGRVITTVRDPARPSVTEAYEAIFAFNFEKYIKKDRFSGSGNLFVPRRVFEKVGGFRGEVSEDIDWCHRANAEGFTLDYAPLAVVEHAARENWRMLAVKCRRISREQYSLSREKPLGALRWVIWTFAVLGSPIIQARSVFRSRQITGLRARSAALAGLACFKALRFVEMWRAMLTWTAPPVES